MQNFAERSTCPTNRSGGLLAGEGWAFPVYAGAPSGVAHCDLVGCDIDASNPALCQRALTAVENVIGLPDDLLESANTLHLEQPPTLHEILLLALRPHPYLLILPTSTPNKILDRLTNSGLHWQTR